MKKNLCFCVFLLLSCNVSASIDFLGKCPEKITCPNNTIQGDDGKCYSCDYPKGIGVHCFRKWKDEEKICPNRKSVAVGWTSYLNCPTENFIEKNNRCYPKCPEGYEGNEIDGCKNSTTGEVYRVNY